MPRKSKKDVVTAENASAPEPEGQASPAASSNEAPEAVTEAPGRVCPSQAVTFKLAGQLYGLPIDVVQEIQQIVEFTPLPDTHPAMLGLIDLRGSVVPAVDLRVLVGLEPTEFTLETPMVFCRVRDHVVCLIVDAVEDVIDVPADGVQAPSGLYSLADRMLGVCRLPQGLVSLLDIERLVPDAALAAADASAGER